MSITLASHDELHNLHNLIETSQPTEDPATTALKADINHLRTLITEREAQIQSLAASLDSCQRELQQARDFPTADPHTALFLTLRGLIKKEIDAVLADTATTKSLLGAISAEHEAKIREIALEVMQEHNDEFDHDSYDAYDNRIDSLEREVENKADTDDIVSERQLSEMVSDAVDGALGDAVSEAVENYMADATITISK